MAYPQDGPRSTDVTPEPAIGLTAGERAELERLRTEVATLRHKPRRGWRAAFATVLIVLGSALAPVAVTAVWLDAQISDTDRYVATVAPLAHDPAIQQAITDRITIEVFRRIDIASITDQAAEVLAGQGAPDAVSTGLRALAVPIANGLQSWTHDQVGRLVASDEFATAWTEANRAAHDQLVAVLTGDNSGVVITRGDTVSVSLATFIEAAKQRLVANGFTLAGRIPAVNAEFVIFESADVGKAQAYFRLARALGTGLPLLVVALLIGGVLVARGRRRAILGASLGVAGGMVLLGVALALLRPMYLNAVPDDVLPSDAAAVVFDTVVAYLRTALRAVLALALVVAVVAYFSGPAAAAVSARRAVGRAAAAVRAGAGARGLRTGPVGTWVGAHKRALQAGIAAAAALAVVFWTSPTAGVVLVIALCALLMLAIIEVVGVTKVEV